MDTIQGDVDESSAGLTYHLSTHGINMSRASIVPDYYLSNRGTEATVATTPDDALQAAMIAKAHPH